MEKSTSLTYKILLHKEPEGSYTVTVPALPGCVTYGDNVDHAIIMAKEAVELYIAELKATGQEIPDDSMTLEYSLNLSDHFSSFILQSFIPYPNTNPPPPTTHSPALADPR